MKLLLVFAAVVAVAIARPSSRSANWSLGELSEALQNPNINPDAVPYLEAALDAIMNALHAGGQLESVVVPLPADIPLYQTIYDIWSLQEISLVLQNPYINPAAVPYFEAALNDIMNALHAGGQLESVQVPLPAEIPLYLNPEAVINPGPVVPSPVPIPSPSPDVPTPAPASSSPLVQVIVNVNSA